ncbi:MAG: phenylalanine--tRNA ligase subunit beta [Alphaproteobacteria bacterium]|nr:phenylalanine--tRNA ligase subunit beta [Alphaproteobacteria bacterium]
MKFTLSWLKDHLETDAAIDQIVEAMTMLGLEVEHVEDPSEKLKAFSVARILDAQPHPNADKLRVCQADTKDGRKEIVCGAPNARAGLVTVYAPIGAYVPGSGITLEARPVRGVVSNGMLCSGAELELDADADGIMELSDDLAIGIPIADALGLSDAVIDFEVTPNRPDWLGVAGIARDLAAAGLGKLKTKAILPVPGRFGSAIDIFTDDASACPVFAGRMVRKIKNGPSPDWLQRRLRAIGLRPRNILVDVTNYLSYDRARPLHVYDADKITGAIRARLGRAGESFKALDGKTYEVTPEMCVIADDARVLGLGGVMGGEESGCSDDTVNVLIESAYFDPLRTFQTGRATGINSDAKYRFERGVDPGFVVPGLDLATRMVLQLCGGEASDMIVAGDIPEGPRAFAFDPDRVRTLAGMNVPAAKSRTILRALGCDVNQDSEAAKRFLVQPPSWRADLQGPADLVEEIARVAGFDELPAAAPPALASGRRPPSSVGESRLRIARRALAAHGYLECVTWSFCARAHAQAFGGGADALVLANPIASDLDCMRPSALPNLLRAAQKNADRGFPDARLFEAGPAYRHDGDDGQVRTIAAIWKPAPKRSWRNPGPPDLFDIKADCLQLLETLSAPVASLQTSAAAPAWWSPGRSGALKLGAKVIAHFGDLHPRALRAIDVEGPALAFEIFVDELPAPRARPTRAKPALEKIDLMPLSRDFAFIVDDRVAAADLVRAALGADKALIADVTLFDVYRGAGVGEGKKSLAIEVTLQPKEKTLAEGDIEAASNAVVAAVMKATGGALRG